MGKSRAANPKRELFEQLASMARAFGSAARLELIDYLAQAERTVEDLSRVAELSIANTSKHLQQLKAAGLVQARRDGKHVWYRLADDRVLDAVGALQELAREHLEEVQALVASYLERRDGLEPVPAHELLERARDSLVTVIDVRPPEEYAQGHIAGAINVPLQRLSRELGRIPREREVVAYCRGPGCVLSFEAVARLREAGLTARRLDGGLPEWRHSGLPVETG
ncbi:MAG: metalloregulator ArsR/SmtB family transcription factor [Gammaproteobacteria bacterium]|nr:metalloregulator ArsR/SmtB family transcription factor [Gammaproteobacteria bacterium]